MEIQKGFLKNSWFNFYKKINKIKFFNIETIWEMYVVNVIKRVMHRMAERRFECLIFDAMTQ
jgi:hypothetical protein